MIDEMWSNRKPCLQVGLLLCQCLREVKPNNLQSLQFCPELNWGPSERAQYVEIYDCIISSTLFTDRLGYGRCFDIWLCTSVTRWHNCRKIPTALLWSCGTGSSLCHLPIDVCTVMFHTANVVPVRRSSVFTSWHTAVSVSACFEVVTAVLTEMCDLWGVTSRMPSRSWEANSSVFWVITRR